MKSIDYFINRVFHADCVELLPEIPSESVDLVVTDPPYLVDYRPRDGRLCHGDNNDYWLRPSFKELYRVLKQNTFCATTYGWPWVERFMTVWKEVGFRPVGHLTWNKSHSSRDGYMRGFHEVGYLLAKGRPPKPRNPIPDVLPWEYTGNELHPNEKPVIAITPLIDAFSGPGQIVIDSFCGSGTTGEAAKACGRGFILIEKVWRHFRTANERLGVKIPSH